MPRRTPKSNDPDLFDFAGEQPPATFEPVAKSASILPTDLSTSLTALPDLELERLLTAVTQEANRRGKEAKSETPTRQSNAPAWKAARTRFAFPAVILVVEWVLIRSVNRRGRAGTQVGGALNGVGQANLARNGPGLHRARTWPAA